MTVDMPEVMFRLEQLGAPGDAPVPKTYFPLNPGSFKNGIIISWLK